MLRLNESFIEKCYKKLDFLIETICKMKHKHKGNVKNQLKNEYYNNNSTTKEKCIFIKKTYDQIRRYK